MNNLTVETLPIATLNPYAGNARTHSPAQIRQIARSIQEFGFINPVLIDADNQLIAGHGRLLGAKQLGLAKIPAVRIEHLSESQRRAYMLADNKLAENADWDKSLLKVEIEYLMQADIDFDVDLTGFSTPELNIILSEETPTSEVDELPSHAAVPEVTELGDLWQLNNHRIGCGDSRDTHLIASLMGDAQARLVITDPPYNVPIKGHVCGNGKHQHAEFAMAAGEMSSDEFCEFLKQSLAMQANTCDDGALLYIFMDWRSLKELMSAAEALNLSPINLCVWSKASGGMGSFYRSQHELVYIVKKGKAAHINNIELGKHGRYRTNVWQYAGMNSFHAHRDASLAMHPTVKPVEMITDAIKDAAHRGDIVVDGFLGSGTTLLAAEQCHRRCYGIELDPRYVDLALFRWHALTGIEPVHIASGMTWSEAGKERALAVSA